MHHKTPESSKEDVPRTVSSVRKILPASRPSSSYTSIWRYQARSDGSRSCSTRKSDGPSSPENRLSCSPTGWGHRPPQEPDLSAIMEIVEDEKETEEEVEFVGDNSSPDASSMNTHSYVRASPSASELVYANFASADRQDSVRDRVMATLGLYRNIYRVLSDEKSKGSIYIRRIDLAAAKEVKIRGGYVHGADQFIGDVPGVEFGDRFYHRMELAVVGLHRPPRNGIDYTGTRPDILATSVVASWEYEDDLTNQDELVYLGEGGMARRGKTAEDQKLTRGNLALVNSMKRNGPVRVIRKEWDQTFRYDGLYTVDRWRKIYRANGKTAFEFVMKRLSGHPETLLRRRRRVDDRHKKIYGFQI